MNEPTPAPARHRALLAVASGVAVALVFARAPLAGHFQFGFLLWNLFLAWIPYLISLSMLDAHRSGRSHLRLVALGVPWLAFLPNAPYLVTDLIHLKQRSVPFAYDATLLGVFALVGLALGMVSLRLVHHVVAARAGSAWGWATALVVLLLNAVGILLGRVYRFNSWDILLDPEGLVQVFGWWVADPLHDPSSLAVLVGGAVVLLVAYGVTCLVGRRWSGARSDALMQA